MISPSFWWGDVQVLQDIKKMKFPKDVKIYMDGGYMESADESWMVQLMRRVYRVLLAMGLKDNENLFYYEDPTGTHSEGSWAKRGKTAGSVYVRTL